MSKAILLSLAALMFAGCAHVERVEIPPRVDLSCYKNIGIIEFSSPRDAKLGLFVTRQFIHEVQAAQPGVRFIELGKKELVLSAVQSCQWDLAAIKAVGREFDVDALVAGEIDISAMKPSVRFATNLTSINARADEEMLLGAKLWETAGAATLWTHSRTERLSVAQVEINSQGKAGFSVSDPEDKYGRIVADLVHGITKDFRHRYEKRRIKQAD